jgi:ketosteroid isomerase-like protein
MRFCYRNHATSGGFAGMCDRNRLIIDATYALWEAGDLLAMMNCFSDHVVFAVSPPSATSILGQGQGKALLSRRLATFLSDYDVIDYLTLSTVERAEWVDCRVRYHYRHKRTGMAIDGHMRHKWLLLDGKIVRFDIIHDARRMGAFFDMAAQMPGVP